jgi:hypothetical protein
MLEFILVNNVALVVVCGVILAVTGMLFRKAASAATDRDNLIFADGFQGATIATLFVVAVTIYYIEDERSIRVLKGQASLVALYAILGCLQSIDRFRRSLGQ